MREKKNWTKKIVVVVIAIVCVAVYFLVPSVNSAMNRVFGMFASGDFDVVRDFVASYGVYAAAVSFLLMIFQSIAAPLPAFSAEPISMNIVCRALLRHTLLPP